MKHPTNIQKFLASDKDRYMLTIRYKNSSNNFDCGKARYYKFIAIISLNRCPTAGQSFPACPPFFPIKICLRPIAEERIQSVTPSPSGHTRHWHPFAAATAVKPFGWRGRPLQQLKINQFNSSLLSFRKALECILNRTSYYLCTCLKLHAIIALITGFLILTHSLATLSIVSFNEKNISNQCNVFVTCWFI